MAAPSEMLIEVAVALPVHGTFTYRVPQALSAAVAIGMRVLVPFGRRRATGYVMGPAVPDERPEIKSILEVIDPRPIFPPALTALFRWASEYYLHPLGEVVKTALPGGLTVSEASVFRLTEEGRRRGDDASVSVAVRAVLGALGRGPLSAAALRRRLGREFRPEALGHLVPQGLILRETRLRGERAKSRYESRFRLLSPDTDHHPGRSPKKALILAALAAAGELSLQELTARVPEAGAHLRSLVASGRVARCARRVFRDPFGEPIEPDAAPVLTAEQEAAVAAIEAARSEGFRCFLLNGVTGSGKTEVYMRLAAERLHTGRGVLVLVPEIALITQTERRFRARFGERIALLHSGLSEGERYDQWCRIMEGKAPIAIGARSAVFAPFADLGLIVVDEEHDTSYKQEGGLPYNARDLAVVRGRQSGCSVILGSATPSLQSTYNVRRGKYVELRLPHRVRQRPLPEVRVVDLRTCRDLRGPGRFISAALKQAIAETLARGDQALIFLNRRGFASFPVCAACGSPLRCRHCDISLTLHQAAQAYRCHYCGFSRPVAAGCERCGSDNIKRLGLGTEKVEEALRALFPLARIARMDRDTTGRKGALIGLLKRLRERAIDILVGTQMVAKGHDFPDITLVGIVCADLSLSFPDFRAAEQTFQLLAQVAGRAGRGDRPGQVILQTYTPDHFSIRTARDQDYDAFFRHEIEFREALGYPPVTRMVQLRIAGRESQRTRATAERLGAACRELLVAETGFGRMIQVMGPAEAALSRIAGHYRWQILLKSPRSGPLQRFVLRLLADGTRGAGDRHVRVVVDVDPLFLM